MAEKPSHLNGAYSGPSVPPPKRYYRHKASDDEGCGCLLSFLFNLVLFAGLAVLVFWLIFHPNKVKFHVTDASLTQFNVNTNNSTTTLLYYNLAVDITVRNPNEKIGIYYDSIEAGAYFEDQKFGSATLTPFYQGHKNTTVLNPAFKGQQVVLLGADELSKLNSEKSAAGVFDIEVKLYLGIRFKVGTVNTWRVKPKIKCELKVPLSLNGTSPCGFETTECHIDFDF
ncbi:hypothetical protein I3843_09G019300 [Carya illinoinensis]|nr:hypothetical protein I3843_09G019300 [Carya illinoinensis]